jgi:hypothetical protein
VNVYKVSASSKRSPFGLLHGPLSSMSRPLEHLNALSAPA